MNLPVAATISEFGITRIAKAMGFPISTINHWHKNDKIPGNEKHAGFRLRRDAFEAAVRKLKAQKERRGRAKRRKAA